MTPVGPLRCPSLPLHTPLLKAIPSIGGVARTGAHAILNVSRTIGDLLVCRTPPSATVERVFGTIQ